MRTGRDGDGGSGPRVGVGVTWRKGDREGGEVGARIGIGMDEGKKGLTQPQASTA
jgi:hypothetical protein